MPRSPWPHPVVFQIEGLATLAARRLTAPRFASLRLSSDDLDDRTEAGVEEPFDNRSFEFHTVEELQWREFLSKLRERHGQILDLWPSGRSTNLTGGVGLEEDDSTGTQCLHHSTVEVDPDRRRDVGEDRDHGVN